MTRDDALLALGLTPGGDYSELTVRAAYAAAMIADHPDHGGAGTHLATLKQARDVLVSHCAVSPCNLCRGVGKVRGRFGAQTCTACGGSGDHR